MHAAGKRRGSAFNPSEDTFQDVIGHAIDTHDKVASAEGGAVAVAAASAGVSGRSKGWISPHDPSAHIDHDWGDDPFGSVGGGGAQAVDVDLFAGSDPFAAHKSSGYGGGGDDDPFAAGADPFASEPDPFDPLR